MDKDDCDRITHSGLGIAGLIQRDRKRLFPLLGLVFNSAITIVLVGIMVIAVTVF